MTFSIIGWVKLGQPVPESNFMLESNNSVLQQMQLYFPGSWRSHSSPLKLGSVPFFRVIRNCSGVSSAFHSASVFSTRRSGLRLPLLANARTSFQLIIFISFCLHVTLVNPCSKLPK